MLAYSMTDFWMSTKRRYERAKEEPRADAPQPEVSPMHLSPPYVKCSRPFQAELNKAGRSEPVPEQVCDGSTCVSPGARFSFSCPDKESDLWQNKKKGICQLLAGWSHPKNQTSRNTHLLSQMMLTGCWVGGGGVNRGGLSSGIFDS